VARHYRSVPVASYRDAVWPVHGAPPADLSRLWGHGNHPLKLPHEFVADVVKHALLALLARRLPPGACPARAPPPSAPATDLRTVAASCVTRPGGPLASYSARWPTDAYAPLAEPAPGSAAWRLYEDVPRKPGWIASGAAPAALVFRLPFSAASPRLEIFFLRSYLGTCCICAGWNASQPGMGVARITIDTGGGGEKPGACAATYEVDARIPQCLSVANVATVGAVDVSAPAGGARRLDLLENSLSLGQFPACALRDGQLVDVRIEAGVVDGASGKFKVLAIASC